MWSTPPPVLPSTETVELIIQICKIDQIFARFLWIKIYFLIPSEAYITVLISNTNIITFDLCLRKESDELLQKRIKLIEVIYLKKLCWIYAQKIKTFLSFPSLTTSLWSSGKIKDWLLFRGLDPLMIFTFTSFIQRSSNSSRRHYLETIALYFLSKRNTKSTLDDWRIV